MSKPNLRAWDSVELGQNGLPIEVNDVHGQVYLIAAVRLDPDVPGEFLPLTGSVTEIGQNFDFLLRGYILPDSIVNNYLTTDISEGGWKTITGSNLQVAKSANNNVVTMTDFPGVELYASLDEQTIIGIHNEVDWGETGNTMLLTIIPLDGDGSVHKYHGSLLILDNT